ncbi:DUF5689 domain-containing protein [Chitinophaga sp. HK235]|uniref:DUF5689 domain-containing protein n=1 Tax=Chitinophaga sp. HK235 TaxID=2952571 RepID=UPI001BA71ACA|nr:DUF5689 domain-containing protein [Chitinophaga sp. HK235]
MNKLYKQFVQFSGAMLMLALVVAGCKKTFDEPPYKDGNPDLQVTNTLAELQAMYKGSPVDITNDMVLSGVVIGDDKSGNLFKQIVIQDNTAGINIQLDASNLNAKYPIGRRVYIKAKGLTLGAYGGLLELGYGVNDSKQPVRIPQALIDSFLVGGSSGNVVAPLELYLDQLNGKYQNMLVKIKRAQVLVADTSKTFGDPTKGQAYVSIGIQDTTKGSLVIRTSSYANFTATKVPKGAGELTGIYTIFNTDNQLVIRDVTDVAKMTGNRNEPVVPPATNIELKTSPLLINFDDIATDLPVGVTVRASASATYLGNDSIAAFKKAPLKWADVAFGFKNFASGTDMTMDSAKQVAATNRALGVRQTGAAEAGVAFVFEIKNTTGKKNLKMSFKLQSLDAASTRVTTWAVDYGAGDTPASFTAANATGTLTTGGGASNNTVTVDFGSALDTSNNKVYIRIVTLGKTSGSGNRASSAIDDVQFSWN